MYSLCSLTPHLSGRQVSSNSYHLEHMCVSRSIRSWKIHVGKDLRDNLMQLPYFAGEKVQPQISKGPCDGLV